MEYGVTSWLIIARFVLGKPRGKPRLHLLGTAQFEWIVWRVLTWGDAVRTVYGMDRRYKSVTQGERVEIRLTSGEKEAWREAARRSAKTMTEWLRGVLNGLVCHEVPEVVRGKERSLGEEIGSAPEEKPLGAPGGCAPSLCSRCRRNLRVGRPVVPGCEECNKGG